MPAISNPATCRVRSPRTRASNSCCRLIKALRIRPLVRTVPAPSKMTLPRLARLSNPAISARRRARFRNCKAISRPPANSAQALPQREDQYVGSSAQQGLSVAQQVQQDYAQLASSLQAGDLSGAQSAFASLQQALQSQGASSTQSSTQSSTNSSSGSDSIANDFNAIGKALSSGEFEPGAERVFTTTDRHSVCPASCGIADPKLYTRTAVAPRRTLPSSVGVTVPAVKTRPRRRPPRTVRPRVIAHRASTFSPDAVSHDW